jgi:tripartite-type tricarboxylate transporter receptor subunit TctC
MWRSRLLALALLTGISFVAAAQEWPSKPVKFVSPYPPGGSVDPLARLLAAKLTDSLKAQFIVENRTGASGIIGTDYVAKSAPDGYTFVFIFDTHSVHQALNPKLPFDPVKDFAPVMLVGYAPMAITTGTMKPYKTFADVLAAAKAKPDTVTIGNVGNGSLAHLTTIVLNQAAGVKLVPVPYKGGGPLSLDLMGGQVELAMASTAAQAQHVKGGKMRALALTGDRRSRTMPEVPTLKELGIDISANAWWGILAPARTPKPIVDKLVIELRKAIALPEVESTLTETLGMEVIALGPEATQKWITDAIARWGKVVRDNGVKIE